jgi:hypothetical protein
MIPFFVNKILPNIHHIFYLVSGDSDIKVSFDFLPKAFQDKFKKEQYYTLLNNKYLIKWLFHDT